MPLQDQSLKSDPAKSDFSDWIQPSLENTMRNTNIRVSIALFALAFAVAHALAQSSPLNAARETARASQLRRSSLKQSGGAPSNSTSQKESNSKSYRVCFYNESESNGENINEKDDQQKIPPDLRDVDLKTRDEIVKKINEMRKENPGAV